MKRFFLGCMLLAFLSSCQKEYSEQFVPYNNNVFNSDTAWKPSNANGIAARLIIPALLTAPMIDSFDAVTGGEIRFPENIIIVFPPHACAGNGSISYTGKIVVEVTYLRKKGDFIRYGKPTTSFNNLLQTGGSFNVVLSQNGIPLNLVPGISYKIKYRNPAPVSDMKFFYEDVWISGADSTTTWTAGLNTAGNVNVWQQYDTATQSIIKGYEITSSKLRWINCDFFNDTTMPYSRINVSLPLNFTNNNTSVYAVFKNKNIVAAFKTDAVSKLFYLPKIPIGSELVLVSVSKIGNDYYLGKKEIIATNANLVSLNPEQKSLAEISNFLNSL